MTREQIRLVRDTFPVLESMGTAMPQLFYGRLFQLDPSTRALFHSDIRVQAAKFSQMLSALVNGLDELASFDTTLRQMGQRHAGYNVKLAHYDLVRDALLWAISQTLGPEWNRDVKAAWTALLEHVNAAMQAGQREVAND
jgi:hemoglobin-like flavoprotein